MAPGGQRKKASRQQGTTVGTCDSGSGAEFAPRPYERAEWLFRNLAMASTDPAASSPVPDHGSIDGEPAPAEVQEDTNDEVARPPQMTTKTWAPGRRP